MNHLDTSHSLMSHTYSINKFSWSYPLNLSWYHLCFSTASILAQYTNLSKLEYCNSVINGLFVFHSALPLSSSLHCSQNDISKHRSNHIILGSHYRKLWTDISNQKPLIIPSRMNPNIIHTSPRDYVFQGELGPFPDTVGESWLLFPSYSGFTSLIK